MWTPLHEIPLITICTSFTPLLLCLRLSTTLIQLLMSVYIHGYTVAFTHFFLNSMLLCQSRKICFLKEPYWNKNVFTSHKVRSLLDYQFTSSPYFTFARNYFKTADFPFYAHSSVLLCYLTIRITSALFTEEKQAVLFPLLKSDLWHSWYYNSSAFLPSPETPVSAADLLVFTRRAPLGLALCISWLIVLSSWSWSHDYHGSSSC